ncbi:zinc-binding dehydrogenase [Mesorhizobium sp.]|uniref:zinc-binding dehydrogenase n=1 Tax=Mesorhizobium sp. TaxID=1871066 RepID=UPI0034501739
MEEAASIPLVGLTAWHALIERSNLKKGQKVFIQAGSGGVGTFAIQLAKHLGATVATTASAASADLVKDLGADVVVDYRKDDFEKILSGYDVVLNSRQNTRKIPERAETGWEAHLHLRSTGSRISQGERTEFDAEAGAALPEPRYADQSKRRGVKFSFLFMWAQGDQLSKITSLIEAGAMATAAFRVHHHCVCRLWCRLDLRPTADTSFDRDRSSNVRKQPPPCTASCAATPRYSRAGTNCGQPVHLMGGVSSVH